MWGCQKLNIDCGKDFSEFIITSFGSEVYSELSKGTKVTEEVLIYFNFQFFS